MPNRLASFREYASALALAGLCLFILGTPGKAGAAGADDARLIQQFAEEKDDAQRIDICRQILETKPALYASYFCEGYSAILNGDDVGAGATLNNLLREQPDFALAAILYGEVYASRNKLDKAEAYFRRAIEMQPGRVDGRFALGSLLLRRGQEEDPKFLPEALEAFRQMTETNPESPDGWASMGLVLTHMGRTADAEQMYQKALARDPRDPFLFDNLAALYSRMNRNEEAEANWRKALAMSPGYGPAVVELAAFYARNEQLARAMEVLEGGRQAVRVPPWGPRIRRNLGFAYLRLGRIDTARERFVDAAASGSDALAFLGLAHVKMLGGDTTGALSDFDAGAALDSSLAIPFVRVWKAALKSALEPGQHSSLSRALARADGQGDRGAGGKAESGSAEGVGAASVTEHGADATPQLVAYVLEGWSFRDAEKVSANIGASAPDSTVAQYDSAPEPLTSFPAEYPEEAQDAGIGGTVQLLVTVDEQGQVVETKVVSKDSPDILNRAATEAAKKWTFKPATRFGAPVRASIIIPFRFKRQGQ